MIHEVTTQVKKNVLKLPYEERFKALQNAYSGKTAYIVSCGPTLNEFDFNKLRDRLKDELVICVKQTYDVLSDVCDFHVYNCGNYKNYDYSKNADCISVECTSYPQFLNEQCDLKFFINERNFARSVSIMKNFDDWTLEGQERPYGPGIMYEIVFYLAQYLGVDKLVTIGWDNTLTIDANQKGFHFYDCKGKENIDQFVTHNEVDKNLAAFKSLPMEASITTDCIADFYFWLKSVGVDLQILSHLNPAPKFIPRIDIENFI